MIPTLAASGAASLSVPLVPAETEFTPRINQFDFALSKSFTFGKITVLPKLDIFNALNSDDYTGVVDLAVRRRDLQASLDDPPGPHHPHRRRPALVALVVGHPLVGHPFRGAFRDFS